MTSEKWLLGVLLLLGSQGCSDTSNEPQKAGDGDRADVSALGSGGARAAPGQAAPSTGEGGTPHEAPSQGSAEEAPSSHAGALVIHSVPHAGTDGGGSPAASGKPVERGADEGAAGTVGEQRELGSEVGGRGAGGHDASGERGTPGTVRGGEVPQPSGGAAGTTGEPAEIPPTNHGQGPVMPGDPVRGYALVVLSNCHRCHGSDLAGRSFYPNITPDTATGVGAWTDTELAYAIRAGIAPTGEVLCAAMPVYSGLKPQEVIDMVAYLRSIAPKENAISQRCPGSHL